MQRGTFVVDTVSGDATSVMFDVGVGVVDTGAGMDFRGPFVHGRRGQRFIYLVWTHADTGEEAVMFRRAKLLLAPLSNLDLSAAVAGQDLVVGAAGADRRARRTSVRVGGTTDDHVAGRRLTRSRLVRPVGHDGGVDVQLLVVGDRPNEGPAAVVLRRALDDVGLQAVGFSTRVMGTQQEAEQVGFVGSPTVLIDGRDPFAEPGHAPALACRVYQGESGPCGVPTLEPLRQALKQAADTDRR